MELVRSSVSIVSGLPCEKVRSAPAIVVSGPAQRLLTLWPARSRSRLATLSIESSDGLVASAAVSIATGWSEPVPGRELHPLKSSAFHGALFRQLAALIVKFRPVFTLYALVDGSKSSSFEPVCKLAVTARCVVKELFFLVSVLAVIPTLHCQAWSQSQTEMILAAEREWAKAAVDRDVATFAKYMSDDYVLIAVDVTAGRQQQFEVATKASWVEKIRSGREKYDSVEIHDLKVFFNGELATAERNQ
jgi:hypothetical protein